jgi:hypothetical protein
MAPVLLFVRVDDVVGISDPALAQWLCKHNPIPHGGVELAAVFVPAPYMGPGAWVKVFDWPIDPDASRRK